MNKLQLIQALKESSNLSKPEAANCSIMRHTSGSGFYDAEMGQFSKIHSRAHIPPSAAQLDVLHALNQFAGAKTQVLGQAEFWALSAWRGNHKPSFSRLHSPVLDWNLSPTGHFKVIPWKSPNLFPRS